MGGLRSVWEGLFIKRPWRKSNAKLLCGQPHASMSAFASASAFACSLKVKADLVLLLLLFSLLSPVGVFAPVSFVKGIARNHTQTRENVQNKHTNIYTAEKKEKNK